LRDRKAARSKPRSKPASGRYNQVMSRRRFAAFVSALVSAALLLPAAPRKTSATAKGENEDLILTVTLYLDPADIKQLLGSDLEGHYFVADVKVEPKYGKEIDLDRDDFVLRTDKNGERTTPYVGSQVAGKNVIVVSKTTARGDGGGGDTQPNYGGMPGPPMGGPLGYPSDGTMIGTGGGAATEVNKATVKTASDEADNPLEKKLDEKILPQKKTAAPVAGLLYFPMEKQKMKDLELRYGGKENRISLRFK
jgi:hypothetical protein